MTFRILTGDRPTGCLHIGHYAGSLRNRVALQEAGHELFILIADLQALTDHAHRPAQVTRHVQEVALDYLGAGLDPERANVHFVVQSAVPELCELTVLLMNLTTVARCQRNPTVKAEIQEKGFGAGVPLGFLAYPVSQAADILGFDADVVPVGVDQLPVLEHTREIAHAVNAAYGEGAVVVPRALLPERTADHRILGLDGKAKMSKSLGNSIDLGDADEAIATKVKRMFTDPTKAGVAAPGRPEANPVYLLLDAFDPDRQGFEALREAYRAGGVPETAGKARLTEVLTGMIRPIRARRQAFQTQPDRVRRYLERGSGAAREVASKVLRRLRGRIGLDDFGRPAAP